jgi:SAM-dependent methyltransferase
VSVGSWTEDPATWPPVASRHREHWLVERELRERLLASRPENRDEVTRDVYNELFRLVPWHAANFEDSDDVAYEDLWFQAYGALVRPDDTLIDLGCGRGALVRRFAPAVRECIGVDASDEMVAFGNAHRPPNVRFVVGDAVRPDLPAGCADIAVSRQVMEHLHPDDVPGHLRTVHRLLRPGGRFLIETPSGLTGPWDCSRGFTATATGLHLHEYTHGELARLLGDAGFDRVTTPILPVRRGLRGRAGARGFLPVTVKSIPERGLRRLPVAVRRKLARAVAAQDVVLLAERRA